MAWVYCIFISWAIKRGDLKRWRGLSERTGTITGRVGLGLIEEDFNVKGIYVSSNTYRTHPIQVFLEPELSIEDLGLLLKYFNFFLEAFREKLDSEFLTTYKYSNAEYTRKYLGLTQARGIIETFPHSRLDEKDKNQLDSSINKRNFNDVLSLLKIIKKK